MDWPLVLVIIFGGLVILMLSGMPVAFAFILVNIIGAILLWGGTEALEQLIFTMWFSIATFTFLPIFMFLLLGEVVFRSGIAMRAVDAVDKWLGRLPGRLGLLAVCMATIFATMSGSMMATAALLGEILVPEMEKRGYKKPMSIGTIMGTGGLAMLIPPSVLGVIWASVAQVSIGKILISGIIPGLIIALFKGIYIVGRCWLQPSIAPAYEVTHTPISGKLIETAKYVLPLSFIVFMVTGLILIGAATPSEAAAMGYLGGLILTAIYGKLRWKMFKESLLSTLRISAMILLIISAAKTFGLILAYTGAIREFTAWVVSLALPPILIIVGMMGVLLLMGMFMNAEPMIMIAIPIFMPIIYALGFDPVWFGLLFLINIMMGATTPPFGMILFVMKGVAPKDTTMGDIYRAGIPFLVCDAIAMALIIAFPVLALWLPGLMVVRR